MKAGTPTAEPKLAKIRCGHHRVVYYYIIDQVFYSKIYIVSWYRIIGGDVNGVIETGQIRINDFRY